MTDPIVDPLAEIDPPTAAQLDRHFSALDDSVALIDRLVAAGSHAPSIDATVDRNVRHIGLMLAKDFITGANRPLDRYRQAEADGNAFLAAAAGSGGQS